VCSSDLMTPLVLEQSVGRHLVSMKTDGYLPYEQEIDLSLGAPGALNVSLISLGDSTRGPFRGDPGLPASLPAPRPLASTLPISVPPPSMPLVAEPGASASGKAPIKSADLPDRAAASANSDRYRIAGSLLGKNFFWESRNMVLDTLDWKKAAGRAGLRADSGVPVSEQIRAAHKQEKQFYELKNGSAVSIALLHRLGYPIMVLSQWSGSIHEDNTDQRSMIEKETAITDFMWESLENAHIKRVSNVSVDLVVDLSFQDHGFSSFRGTENLSLARSQILGTAGFSLSDKTKGLMPEPNQYRLIVRVLLVGESSRKTNAITDDLNHSMDSLKLDLSYKAPEIRPVSR
jgi:hypothetical protein